MIEIKEAKIRDDDSRICLEISHKIFVRLNFKEIFRIDKKKIKKEK